VVPDSGASTFKAPLAGSLSAGQFVYITEVATPVPAAAAITLEGPVIEVSAAPAITSPLTAATTLSSISGTGQATNANFSDIQIFVCSQSALQKPVGTPDCSAKGNSPLSNAASATSPSVSPNSNGAFSATVATPIATGSYVWVTQAATPKATGAAAQISSTLPVAVTATTTAGQPQFGAKPVAGQSTVTVIAGKPNDSVSIWAFDSNTSVDPTNTKGLPAMGNPLLIVTTAAGAATSTTTTAQQLTSSAPTTLNLQQPLVAGQTLWLAEAAQSGGTLTWAEAPTPVTDPNDYGLFRTYFTIGAQATNQLGSTGSSSVGQYVDVGFNATYRKATNTWDTTCGPDKKKKCSKFGPGIMSNIDFRLSPIPVAATSTTTNTTGISATTIAPNQLSTQQSARGVIAEYLPWKVGSGWNNHTDYFTIAPLGTASFGTLLNPTSSSSSSASSGSGSGAPTTQVTQTSFANGYYSWGGGLRFAWDRYSPDVNEGPKMMTQVTITLGEDSNLSNYVCKPVTGQTSDPYSATSMTTITTACSLDPHGATSPATSPVTYFYSEYSRTLLPRMDVSAIAKLPNFPFLLGVDANLQQYLIGTSSRLDYLNKPGNDVRVFVGIQVDFATLFSKL
jgi:hypothetical protein